MKRQEWSNWASGTCNLRNGCCTKADFLAWVAWIRVAHAVCRSLGPFPSDLSNFLSRPLREIINTKSPTSVRWCWRNNQQWRAWVWVPGKAGREQEMHRGFDFLGYRGFCLLWYGTGCHLKFPDIIHSLLSRINLAFPQKSPSDKTDQVFCSFTG